MNYNINHYAYIGDCVFELFIRELAIKKTQKPQEFHKFSIKYVCADFQAELINFLKDKLTPDEVEIQKRGRNIKMSINKKNNPKIHSLANSFEVLIGFWYLNDKNRLNEIFEIIKPNLEDLK